jgi:hypothetical protein
MAAERQPHEGYEKRDTQVKTLTWLLAALLAAIVVVVGMMVALFDHLAEREAERQPTPSTLAGTRSVLPPEPRLQNTPFDDLKRLRAEEDLLLNSYGWVDRSAGVVRIPIERALEIAGKNGLEEAPRPDSEQARRAKP